MAAATPPHLGPMQASPRAPFHRQDRGIGVDSKLVKLASSGSWRRNEDSGGISSTDGAGNLAEVSVQNTSVDAAAAEGVGTGDRESSASHWLGKRDECCAASHADRLGSVDGANGSFSSETDRAADLEYGTSVGDPSHKQMDPQGLDPDIEMGLTTVRGKVDALKTADTQELPAAAEVDGERICRVCHVGLYAPGTGEPMELACACKQDLALCHRQCAEEWFKVRGNRTCEICGQTVQNLTTDLETSTEAASGFEARLDHAVTINGPPGPRIGRFRQVFWHRKAVRNFLLATLVAIFMIPWFFRIAYYTS